MKKIAFNTANLVGRVTGYRFELKNWGDQHNATVAKTDEAEWVKICHEIAAEGYTALEVWKAHLDASAITPKRAQQRLKIMHDFGLSAIAYAGGLDRPTAELCAAAGIRRVAGGFPKDKIEEISALCEEYDLEQHYENHPEKSVAEILDRIAGGSDRIGVAIDTGWCGTQGLDVKETVIGLGNKVRHIHVKDVAAAGGHHTVPLGTGVVDLEGLFVELKKIQFDGWFSWEDEPEDRNPFDVAAESLAYIAARTL